MAASRPPRARGSRPGFTLLEAMIALVILGLAAVAALSAFGTELRAADRARHALEAEALAAERLATVRLLGARELAPLPDSIARGRFAAPFESYHWTTTLRPVLGEPALYSVVTTIAWERGTFAVQTRLYRPPPVLPALAPAR